MNDEVLDQQLESIFRRLSQLQEASNALANSRQEAEEISTALREFQHIYTDIRRQSHHPLAVSENFNQALLDGIKAHVAVLDKDGNIILVNDAWKQFAQNNGDPTLAHTGVGINYLSVCRMAVSRGSRKAAEALTGIQSVLAGDEAYFTLEYPCHSPTKQAWYILQAAPLTGDYEGAVAIHIDISDRKLAEELLLREHNLLRTLIDNLPDYIYFKDRQSRFIVTNQASAQILGAESPDDVVGKTDFDYYPAEFAAAYYSDEQTIFTEGQPLIDKEEPHIDAAGTHRWVLTTKIPMRNEAGEVIGVVGISRDITERKKIELEKEHLIKEISRQRQQLRALTGRLAEAQETERKNLARELHDQVGQSLSALNLNLSAVRTRIKNGPPQSLETTMSLIDDSIALLEQTAECIQDVMADLRPPVLDDYGLVAAIRWYGKQLARQGKFKFTVKGQEPTPRLAPANEHTLFRIAQEALLNAAKHAQARKVNVMLETEEKLVRMVVVDDGLGFDLEGPVAALSWGLLTMKERAEAIGGSWRIESEPAQGTRVVVEVPR
ncbi:MAG: PAS domain-containing protein [Anaerolineae bacterium]|nr:PAS domain-containing protein [Anaerolineae bacterium]